MSEPDERLYKRLTAFREDVFRLCLGFSRNTSDAEDLCQDVFLKAFARKESLRSPDASRIWLLRIARTTCLDRIRREKRHPMISIDSLPGFAGDKANPDPPVEAALDLRRVKDAVRRLPSRQKEVFVLREYSALSYEEISLALKIKMGTVMSRLNRARLAVAKAVKEGRDEKK